ncbi:MAG: hypothetical protein PHW73_07000 [Atribacterota bacterium]|nr:hypothetical protein [Atribacterota bacterium]
MQSGDLDYITGQTHGLIVATSDQSTGTEGYFSNATNDGETSATATVLGTGNANTNTIVTAYGTETNAAKLCAELVSTK